MTENLKNSVLWIILLCCMIPLSAQKKSFQPGYIITYSGDTIQGLVKDRSREPFVKLYDKIRFRKMGASRTRRYAPETILGYGYQGQHFISMPLREESTLFKFRYYIDRSAPQVFLKAIEQSEGLLYLEQLIQDDDDYLDSVPFFYRPGRSDLVRVTQGIFGLRKKRLSAYFSDCPALVEEITKPDSKLRTVADLYEFCIANCKL